MRLGGEKVSSLFIVPASSDIDYVNIDWKVRRCTLTRSVPIQTTGLEERRGLLPVLGIME